jgi:hypothetical protein
MDLVSYGAKAALCTVLLVAGGAKFADLSGFASTVRLFMPRYRRTLRRLPRFLAAAVATVEIALGIASLLLPALAWLNVAVLCLAGAFLAVSAIGYAFHRNRSCRCFGALSQRKFDLKAILRGAVLAVLAAIVVANPHTSQLNAAHSVLLGLAAALLALAALSAARSLNIVRGAHPDLALQ